MIGLVCLLAGTPLVSHFYPADNISPFFELLVYNPFYIEATANDIAADRVNEPVLPSGETLLWLAYYQAVYAPDPAERACMRAVATLLENKGACKTVAVPGKESLLDMMHHAIMSDADDIDSSDASLGISVCSFSDDDESIINFSDDDELPSIHAAQAPNLCINDWQYDSDYESDCSSDMDIASN